MTANQHHDPQTPANVKYDQQFPCLAKSAGSAGVLILLAQQQRGKQAEGQPVTTNQQHGSWAPA
jgi:hypothetical protein